MKITLATRVTIFRIFLIPVFVASLFHAPAYGWPKIPFLLFLFAASLDALDGFLARVRNERTPLGALLDPMADKFLVVAALLFLGWHSLPAWIAVLLLAREALHLAGYLLLFFAGGDTEIAPSPAGKVTTFCEFLLLLYLLFHLDRIPERLDAVFYAFLWATLAFALASSFLYLREWGRRMAAEAEEAKG